VSINNPKDRMDFLTSALLNMSDEDSGGFRTLVARRPPEYRLLERRGLIYRTMTCVPERCQYRQYHGSVPSGDCRREGWTLSLRGRLVAGLLSTGVRFDLALQRATENERNYTATTIIHRRVDDRATRVILGADLPTVPRGRRERGRVTAPQSAAERAFDGQLVRLGYLERQLGDKHTSFQAIHSALTPVRYQMRKRPEQ
jgi:hypothetical protein